MGSVDATVAVVPSEVDTVLDTNAAVLVSVGATDEAVESVIVD